MTEPYPPRRPHLASRQTIGQRGEELVSHWLQQLGWHILYQRWRCRWGELDIVARTPEPTSMLIVVEVKVRNRGNWDKAGLLSITPQKQRKLLQATELFLAEHEALVDYPCRFDIALVQRASKPTGNLKGEHGGHPQSSFSPSSSINSLDQAAIAPFLGLPSAPIQAIQASQIPCVWVGSEILQLQHYLSNAFDAQ